MIAVDNQKLFKLMLRPTVAFLIGLLVIAYAMFTYRGSPVTKYLPGKKFFYSDSIILISLILVGLSLTLGLIGFSVGTHSEILHTLRIVLGISGVVSFAAQVLRRDGLNQAKQSINSSWDIQQFLIAVHHYLELLQVLVGRNLKVRYRGSFLGVYWSLLSPIVMTGLYTAVFGTAFSSYYNHSIISYVMAAFTGLIVINFFAASTSQSLVSIVQNGTLLNKIRLPISVFPLSILVANTFQLLVGIFPVLAIMTFFRSESLLNVIALPLPFIALILLCSGVGLFVSSMYVFYRDLPYFYELVVFVLWIGSPVFYPSAIVPAVVKPYINLNPIVPIIDSIRQIVLSQSPPDTSLISRALLSGIICSILGMIFFRSCRSKFLDLL
jgi:lipopolysaccharide transport system permease protein